MVQILPSNTFTTAKWIVSATASDGTHTTISAALTSSSSGDTIFIRPGTYTENLTLKAGVNLAAFVADSLTPNVTIIGKLSASYSGTSSVSNIKLQTNSDNIVAMTGANATVLYLSNCVLNCSTTTGISSTGSNASSSIQILNCSANLGTTGIGFFTVSNGTIGINYTGITNTGGSSTASTVSSAAGIQALYSIVNIPITTSNTSTFSFFDCSMDTSGTNTTALTINGTGASNLLKSRVASGSATPISVGSGATLTTDCLTLNSSNAAAVSGAGTFVYSELSQESSTYGTLSSTTVTPRKGFGVVQTVFSNLIAGSSTSSLTYVDVTSANLAITPSSASNKILVIFSFLSQTPIVAATNSQQYNQVLRGASVISGTDTMQTWAISAAGGLASSQWVNWTLVDSPASTSAQTYKLQHKAITANAGNSFNVNITLMEIVA